MRRQVRVRGPIETVSDAEADASEAAPGEAGAGAEETPAEAGAAETPTEAGAEESPDEAAPESAS